MTKKPESVRKCIQEELHAGITQIEAVGGYKDTKYHVLVTGMSGDIGSPQCFHHHTFSTPAKTKDYGPDIEVTALPEISTPYAAAFNVKCTETPENPLVTCYYGANYYKDWVLEVNGGTSYEALGQTTMFTEEEIEQFCVDLPRYKRPKKIFFDTVPRNPTGKIEKPKLRKIYGSEQLVASQNNS